MKARQLQQLPMTPDSARNEHEDQMESQSPPLRRIVSRDCELRPVGRLPEILERYSDTLSSKVEIA